MGFLFPFVSEIRNSAIRFRQIYSDAKNKRVRAINGKQDKAIFEQAYRTSWKLAFEWIDIQATMIELGQVEAIEVFMPYLIVDKAGTTLFEMAKSNGSYGPKLLEHKS
jgi:hypothetical protein